MKVYIKEQYIKILDNGKELVYWDKQEWIEYPQLTTVIAHAIVMALTEPDKFRKHIKETTNG
jgi:hypothetical protein